MRPELAGLELADRPERWADLGFVVEGGRLEVGGVHLVLGGAGEGIVSWTLRHVAVDDIDGLATSVESGASPVRGDPIAHPNGAIAIDHVVVVSPEFDRTAAALEEAGLPLRRIRDAGGFRQGFRRLGPAILELVETPDAPARMARFWGLVVTVSDLNALAERLGDRLGGVRAAVQPGRRIAPLGRAAGLGAAVAFMDPEPGRAR